MTNQTNSTSYFKNAIFFCLQHNSMHGKGLFCTERAGLMNMTLPITDLLTNPATFLFWFSSAVTKNENSFSASM